MKVVGTWPVSAVVLALCVFGAGCGEGEDEASSESTAGLSSEPAQLVREVFDAVIAAKGPPDCKTVTAVNKRSNFAVACPPPDSASRKAARDVRLTDAETYGTAAVVDYTTRKSGKGASIVMYRDPQGRWTIGELGYGDGKTVGTSDDDTRKAATTTVDKYLAAVRDRNCAQFFRYAVTRIAEKRKACRIELPDDLVKALRANPDAAPRHLGGSEMFSFYGLSFQKPRPAYFTIATLKRPEGALNPHIVLSVEPGPPSG